MIGDPRATPGQVHDDANPARDRCQPRSRDRVRAGHRPARPAAPAPLDPSTDAVAAELERLDRGLAQARTEAEAAEAEARKDLGPQYADILAAHAQMISDPTLRSDARARVERDRITAEDAVSEVLEGHAARLERLTDSHLAARASDVRDIMRRILGQLSGQQPPTLDGTATARP